MRMAALRRTVLHDHGPLETAGTERAVLYVCGTPRERDGVTALPLAGAGDGDGGNGCVLAGEYGLTDGARGTVVVGHLQTHVDGARAVVRAANGQPGAIVVLTVTIEIPGVAEHIGRIGIARSRAAEADGER